MSNYNSDIVKIAAMLSTRLCHDLAGPISAVNNGIELVTEEGASYEMRQEIAQLLSLSSQESLAKLQMFRMAYGHSSSDNSSEIDEVKDIVQRFFNNNKIEIDWNDESGFENKIDNQSRRILILMILILSSVLIFGGILRIRKKQNNMIISGVAPRIKENLLYKEILRDGLTQQSQVTPENVIAYYLQIVAAEHDIIIEYSTTSDGVEVATR